MKRLNLILFIVFSSFILKAQTNVSGYIYDKSTHEVLINAIVYDSINQHGTVTNSQGYFAFRTNSDNFVVKYVGYEQKTILLKQTTDTIIHIYLDKSAELLHQVEITATKYNSMNISRLDIDDIIDVPALGGQVDVLKSAQILPGIQTQAEGSSMLIVRGGDPGQNMYLLDNTALIYVNHLGGFMSVFNSEMINDMTIYKGGFPAKYGGKLSSIVDITQKEGNSSKMKGSLGIGITDANLCLEGGIGKNITYITTARKTLFDPLLLLASSLSDGNTSRFFYGFHDVNLKVTWKANSKSKFAFNVFQGDDYINFYSKPSVYDTANSKTTYLNSWGNIMTSASWNYLMNAKTFGRTIVSFTRYRAKDKQSYNSDVEDEYNNTFLSSVYDYSLNSVWNRMINNSWNIEGGLHSSYINYTPYSYTVEGVNNFSKKISESILNNSLSLNNKIKISDIIDANIGLRYTTYYYADKFDMNLEPRIDININLSKFGNINANYMIVNQPTHLFISTGNIKSNEVWLPASDIIPISKSEQFSLAWNISFNKNMFDLSLGVYNKELSNLITANEAFYSFKELEDWGNIVEIGGVGHVQGLELMFRKNYGKWTGIISYHLSNADRQFDNINNGQTYQYEYNRPHDLSIFVKRKLGDKWSFSVAWYYQSGLPYTPIIGRQMVYDPNRVTYYEANIYGDRNSARMKDYHRLDIAFKYEKISRNNLRSVWTFSIYNVYARQNPTYYYLNSNKTPEIYSPINSFDDRGFWNWQEVDLYQMSLFTFIPSVSYKVYFDEISFKKFSFKDWMKYE